MPKYEGETKIYYTDSDGKSHELHFESGSWHAHDNVDECRKVTVIGMTVIGN